MKRIYITIFSLLFVVACAYKTTNQQLVVDTQNPVIVELEDYTPIPLIAEPDNANTLVASPIKNVERVGDKLIMMGMMSGEFQIIVYDTKSGKYISRIGNKGRAENEYSMITSFRVNQMGNVVIYDRPARKYIEYELNGKYVTTQSAPKIPYADIVTLGDGYVTSLFNNAGSDLSMLTYYNSDFSSSEPVGDVKQSYAMAQYKLLQDGEQAYAISPIERKIWRINPDKTLSQVCEMDFGENNFPSLESFTSEKSLLDAMSDKRYVRGFNVKSLSDGFVVFRYMLSSSMLAWADLKSGKAQSLQVNCKDQIIYRGIHDRDLIVITETEDNANLYLIKDCTSLQ